MLREKAKASKRRAILDAAERQFARRAYDQVLLEDIAAAADVAKGTLYLYFENKAALYLALLAESVEPMMAQLERDVPAAARKSAWAGIELIVRELLRFKAAHPALHEVMRETTPASQEAICGDLKRPIRLLLERTLEEGVERGEIVDPHPQLTADLILGSIARVGPWLAGRRSGWTPDSVASHLLRIFSHGLLPGRRVRNAITELERS